MKITKKKVVLCSIISLILIGGIILAYNLGKSDSPTLAESKPNKLINNSFLTLMLEQSDGTYQESTSNTWPSGNYAFNESLSRCENGGELRWNREEGIVNLLSNKSDACYVYFDLYNVVTITNVQATKTTNSVTLTVTVDAGENPVATYYFSMDGGRSYETSTSPNYTFSELTPNTSYTFQVYAVDTEGYESNEETIEVTTDNYVNPVVNSVTITDTTTSTISIRVSASGGTNSVATYYYSINNGAYSSSSSNTKTFTGLSKGTTYTIKVYVKDTNGVDSSVKTTSAETENLTYICTTGTNLATCIKSQYTSQGSNGIYYHTRSLANSAGDNSYRYAGSNPNNYVCFGSTSSTCPSNNLYRIIGVFGSEVKLIKASSYGRYAWDSNNNNTWSTSSIRTILNSTYLSTLTSTWQNKIATHRWKVGGMTDSNGRSTPQTAYNYEVGSSSSSTTDSMKIGLMYVSDYGYAASNSYWTTALDSYDPAVSSNWLAGMDDYFITRVNNYSHIFRLWFFGAVDITSPVNASYIRPSFYLTSSITYVSGSGTSSDPIRIN